MLVILETLTMVVSDDAVSCTACGPKFPVALPQAVEDVFFEDDWVETAPTHVRLKDVPLCQIACHKVQSGL